MKKLPEPTLQLLLWAACVVASFPLCSSAQRNLKDIPDPDPEARSVANQPASLPKIRLPMKITTRLLANGNNVAATNRFLMICCVSVIGRGVQSNPADLA